MMMLLLRLVVVGVVVVDYHDVYDGVVDVVVIGVVVDAFEYSDEYVETTSVRLQPACACDEFGMS